MNGTPRTIWSRRSSVRCLWWVSLRCCNGRRLALASILRLGETHARAAVRAQEWVGERRTQSETHSLIRTHAIAKHFLPIAVACYVAFWIALAIHPLDRSDWLLENLLIFISVIVVAFSYRKFRFSNLSYALIVVFLAFHTIGAHYTYAKVPAGFWMQDCLHLNRNHYDRVIHFSFGFLLLYPMRELLVRSVHAGKQWGTWLAVAALAA